MSSVMIDLEGLELTSAEHDLLLHPAVAGIVLFSRNYHSPQQMNALTDSIRAIRSDLLIAADQEGGRVQRFTEGFLKLPPLQAIGHLYQKSPEDACEMSKRLGWLMAAEVIAAGVDLSFAPVLDCDANHSAVINNRSFSENPNEVIALAEAYIQGMHQAGMSSVGKHFPGHGSVQADTHHSLPTSPLSLNEMAQSHTQVFKTLGDNGLDAVMTAHIHFTAIDSRPVTFSSFWLKDYLKEALGFQGIIISDCLSMKGASAYATGLKRAEDALEAGCDLILVCNNRQLALEVINSSYVQQRPANTPYQPLFKQQDYQWEALHQSEQWLQSLSKVKQYGLVND